MAPGSVGNYKIEPFKVWSKFKEFRRDNYQEITEARERGKVVVAGSAVCPEVFSGFENLAFLKGEPYGATVGNNRDFQTRCFEEMEARGWARDLCGYLRGYLGSMYLDETPWGSPFPRAAFIFTTHSCDTHAKWYQAEAEHLGIPMFVIDSPGVGWAPGEENHGTEYLKAQLNEGIEWMEKQLGQKFDDEKFIDAVVNEHLSKQYWGDIVTLNRSIPAPIDEKSLATFYLPAVHRGFTREAVELYRELRDETKYRVENQIAALATERCRLVHENIPPWYALNVFRYMEKFGAVCIGSTYLFRFGGWYDDVDTAWRRREKFDPVKERPRDRGQALDSVVEFMMTRGGGGRGAGGGFSCIAKARRVAELCQLWKADGAIWHLNRGCEGVSLGDMQARLVVQRELGIPTCVYEGNQADAREWNEAQVFDRIDAFMETLGLARLVD